MTTTELKKDLAAVQDIAAKASLKPAELEARREILLTRRAKAAASVTDSASEKTIAVRKLQNGEFTESECNAAIASADITHQAAGFEMQTTHGELQAIDAKLAAAQQECSAALEAMESARAELVTEIIVVERARAQQALAEGLARLDAALRLKPGYIRTDLLDAVGKILDRAGNLRDQAAAAIENEYLA